MEANVHSAWMWLALAAATVLALFLLRRSSALGPNALALTAAGLVLLSLPACAPYDPGGNMVTASQNMLEARTEHKTVEIRGACYSACALKLGSGSGVCVAPTARIGVHEVRVADSAWDYRQGARNALATAFFEGMLPYCARTAFSARHGFDSGNLVVMSGAEVLSACPQLHACA